jgi:hypothetical protein
MSSSTVVFNSHILKFILLCIFILSQLGNYIDFLILYMLIDGTSYEIHFKTVKKTLQYTCYGETLGVIQLRINDKNVH